MPGNHRTCRLWRAALIALMWSGAANAANDQPGSAADLDSRAAQVLGQHCLDCHNPSERKGGLDLTSPGGFRKGGDSGPVFSVDSPRESLLLARVAQGDMPPERPLQADEIAILRNWILDGANWQTDHIDRFQWTTDRRAGYDWWALQPLDRPAPPDVERSAWIINPIDRFIRARLDEAGLEPSAPADRRTLIRRVSFDLLGLPPTPEQVADFLQDDRPDAYERLVDRLLASPHYGEHWARHWLDVIRFGESQGFERDKFRPHQWRYRDWVVDALNADLAYDEFARLQLAGDALKPGAPEGIIATGFLVAGAYDEVGQNQQSDAMKAVVRQDEMEDLVSAVGQTFLGLTLHCARCHDHKFDPITQDEYYQICATLAGVRHGERQIASVPVLRSIRQITEELQARLHDVERGLTSLRDQARGTGTTAAPSDEDVANKLPSPERQHWQDLRFERDQLKQQLERAGETLAYAVDPRPPGPVHVLARGNPASPLHEVQAKGVRAIRGLDPKFDLPHDAPEALRRVRLAEWITDRENPLFARVIVNRLWHWHFGTGIVNTPSDFGFNGGRPSHPALLDWLACEAQAHDFRLKPLQRLIVTSAAYRQGSRLRAEPLAKDAGNRLLWRKSPQRLEAESLRDTMRFVAGRLNRALGGPGYIDFTTYTRNAQFYEVHDPSGWSFCRRSLYRAWIRSGRSRFLDVFDCPDPSTKTPVRAVTTTPLQSLSLMNHSFTLRMADRLAERLESEQPGLSAAQIRRVYRLLLGRDADPAELDLAQAFVEKHGMAAFCRVMFNTNEFLHVE